LGRVLKVTDFENRVIDYTWTATGQKESIKYPDGSQVFYQYDKLGRMTQVEDALGKITNYQYDSMGNVLKRVLPNGSSTQYQYDLGNRLVKTFGDYLTPESYSNLGEPIQGEDEGVPYLEYLDTKFKDFQYDDRGNLIQISIIL